MYRGFYTLTSGMMTQQTNLNTISNNMANASTPGYKRDTLATTTFAELVLSRTGNVDKSNTQALNGSASLIRVPDESVTDYTQGSFETTNRVFDVALTNRGFFEIITPDGGRVYTRNGSFTLDNEGNLLLQHVGRVAGSDGEPIHLGTDDISITKQGDIFNRNGQQLGALRVMDFNDYGQLEKTGEGMFLNANAANMVEGQPSISWKMLERSNVVAVQEMTSMLTSQRALQSASQILKIYDGLMGKSVNDIGRQ